MTYGQHILAELRWYIAFGTILAASGFAVACLISTIALINLRGDLKRWTGNPSYFLIHNAQAYCLPATVLGCVLLILLPGA